MTTKSKAVAEEMVGINYHALKKDYDIFAKILVLGDEGVGKSSLVMRFAEDLFGLSYVATIGIDFKSKILGVGGNRVKLEIWDTAGQERFRNLTQAYYRNAEGILLAFSLADGGSFQNLEKWMESVSEGVGEKCPMVLVGTKSDVEGREVERTRAEQLSERLGLVYFQVSAKENVNVQECFLSLCQSVCERKLQEKAGLRGTRLSSYLVEEQKQSGKRCRC